MSLELKEVALKWHVDFGEGPYFGFQMILESMFLRDVLRSALFRWLLRMRRCWSRDVVSRCVQDRRFRTCLKVYVVCVALALCLCVSGFDDIHSYAYRAPIVCEVVLATTPGL